MSEINIDAEIVTLKAQGYGSRAIANILGIGKSTVNRRFNKTNQTPRNHKQRILFFDLETSPSVVATFGRWKQNIGTESVISEGGVILTACWQFSDSPKIHKIKLTSKEAIAGDDSRIVAELYDAVESVDSVCAHNLEKFDWSVFKTRLLANGMPPPKRVKLIDTLKIAKQLKFNSNKLDALGKYTGSGRKIDTGGIDLWIRCINGDTKALTEMMEYNAQDIVVLREVYYAIRAFDTRPSGIELHHHHDGKIHCPVCGSEEMHLTGNVVTTQVSMFAEYQCHDCGYRARSRKTLNSKEERALIVL